MDEELTMRMREGAHLDCRHFDRAKMVTNSTSFCNPCAAQDAFVSRCILVPSRQAGRRLSPGSPHVSKDM